MKNEETQIMNAAKYKIKSFQDVIDQVPTERIALCMQEIAQGMIQTKATLEAAIELIKASGVKPPENLQSLCKWPDEIEWIDDGKEEVITRLHAESGQPLATVKTAPGILELTQMKSDPLPNPLTHDFYGNPKPPTGL